MAVFEIVIVTLTCGIAVISLGGGLYETGIVDTVWPARPDIVSPRHGGINRKWFWIPAHSAFELMLILSIVITWTEPSIRTWLFVAFGIHAVMRIWSVIDFIPKALRFEAMEPTDINKIDAQRWTRRSRFRVMLDSVKCVAMFGAVIALAKLG